MNGIIWNGKGKIFYDSYVKFEGEYSKGKKLRGKTYDNKGYLRFDGEYLNDEYWTGKIFHYYTPGNIAFEGDYKNGKENGFGKKYTEKGKIEFEGEYLNGEKMEKEENMIQKEI